MPLTAPENRPLFAIAMLAGCLLAALPVLASELTYPPEQPDDPPSGVGRADLPRSEGSRIGFSSAITGSLISVQVNVDSEGLNIVGDAANEPSIAIDPTDPDRVVIAWRQFDSITSNFRQAGYAYSTDGGATWTFPEPLDAGVFRSDPVLDFDIGGVFYLNSLRGDLTTDVFRSSDGGATWDSGVFAFGGDKQWMAIDRSSSTGQGHIYAIWSPVFTASPPSSFTRSSDGGASYETPVAIDGAGLQLGSVAVGADGAVYAVGDPSNGPGISVAKSTTMADPKAPLAFDFVTPIALGGEVAIGGPPNPVGLIGQIWIAVDPGDASRVYVMASVDPPGDDPADVRFTRSTDGGVNWSPSVRLNDDPADNGAWQWFGTLSVAPNGRLDAIWNDSRADADGVDSALYYSYSEDGGLTWSANTALAPAWDPQVGWPQQDKIGDYYHMVSFDDAAHLAYAATYNGEQDVYYLRIPAPALFADGFESGDLTAWSSAAPAVAEARQPRDRQAPELRSTGAPRAVRSSGTEVGIGEEHR